jgi:hypothetical protein
MRYLRVAHINKRHVMKAYGRKFRLLFLGTRSVWKLWVSCTPFHFYSWEMGLSTHNISGCLGPEIVYNVDREALYCSFLNRTKFICSLTR